MQNCTHAAGKPNVFSASVYVCVLVNYTLAFVMRWLSFQTMHIRSIRFQAKRKNPTKLIKYFYFVNISYVFVQVVCVCMCVYVFCISLYAAALRETFKDFKVKIGAGNRHHYT